MLPSIHPEYHTSEDFQQPQLTKYHHAFRSPMSTEKMNLEANQLRYDIFKLRERLNNIQSNTEDSFSVVIDGSDLDTYLYSATPTSIQSVEGLVQILNGLSHRLEILEKGLQ